MERGSDQMAATETVLISVRTNQAGGTRRGAGQVALLAPLEGGATVSAGIFSRYLRPEDAVTDFGAGTDLAEAVTAALDAGAPVVYAGGVPILTGSPFTETFGAGSSITTGTLTAARMPITSITSVTRDGTVITPNIVYTHGDPTLLTPAANAIAINPYSGAFKLGTATTGASSGLVVVYASHDWDSAFASLDLKDYEYHAPAGRPFNAANYGLYRKFMTHANTQNKLVAAAFESGVAPEDVDDLVTAFHTLNGGRLKLLAAYYTGDLSAAFMGNEASRPVHGTSKEQPAPDGVVYTDTYLPNEFGTEEVPDAADFHGFGANAVYQDRLGVYRITNDRAATALGDFERFHSTRRSIRRTVQDVEDSLLAARQGNPLAFPYTDAGLLAIKGNIERTLSALADEGVIDREFNEVRMVPLSLISDADRLNRVVPGVDVFIRLSGQVHLIKINLNVEV